MPSATGPTASTQRREPAAAQAPVPPACAPPTRGRLMLRSYWRTVFRPFWPSILLMAGLSGLAAAAGLLSVSLVIPLVGTLMAPGPAPQDALTQWTMRLVRDRVGPDDAAAMVALLAIMGLALALRGLLLVLNQWITYAMAIRAWHRIYQHMFRALLGMPYAEIAQRSKGALLQDIQAPSMAISEVIAHTSRGLVAVTELALLAGFIMRLAWWAFLACVVFGGLCAYAMRRAVLRRADSYNRRAYALLQQAAALITDALDGIRVVKLTNSAERFLGRLTSLLSAQRRLGIAYGVWAEVPPAFLEFLIVLPVVVVVCLCLWQPSLRLSPAALAALVVAICRIRPPAQTLAQAAVALAANLRKIEIIDEQLTALPAESSGREAGQLPARIRVVELEDVTFRYPGRPDAGPMLDGVSLRFLRGQVSAIVGSTGAGKTTIADLLVRLYEPERGAIRVDGLDLREVDVRQWRARVGYVGQDPFLFNASLRDNITLWDPSITAAQVRWATDAAQLSEFIAELPQGYDTVVGDRGVRLSGGQRQRVAIARAILHRPDVLIFDEATSALDNVTERAVHTAISELKRRAAIILIAHRLSTVRDADQIVVLDGGRVVETGAHDELLAVRGAYWRLYQRDEEAGPPAEAAAARAGDAL